MNAGNVYFLITILLDPDTIPQITGLGSRLGACADNARFIGHICAYTTH
jgi:hypothetical protein